MWAKIVAELAGLLNALLARRERLAERDDGAREQREADARAALDRQEGARRLSAGADDDERLRALREVFTERR